MLSKSLNRFVMSLDPVSLRGLLSILPMKAVVAMLLAFRLGLYPKSKESISISMAQTSIFLPSRLNGAIWRKYVLHFYSAGSF